MDERIRIPTTTIPGQAGPARYRWRRLLALIRPPDQVVLTPSAGEFQPNDIAVAVFSGDWGAPAGWTQLKGSPGVFYRTYANGDEL